MDEFPMSRSNGQASAHSQSSPQRGSSKPGEGAHETPKKRRSWASSAGASHASASLPKKQRECAEASDEDEPTDDEDSDDEERELLAKRLEAEELAFRQPDITELDEKARQAPHLLPSARPVPYQLVVPTYGRWCPVREMTRKLRFMKDTRPFILAHTLGFLERQGIPKRRVTLFVANNTEASHYRNALQGSFWADVRIEISVKGNMKSRNFIYKFFPAGTYVVSIDDDVERVAWKYREGITHHVLRYLPAGGLEKLIFDAFRLMQEKKAFLWGLSTSQNPRHMRTYGVSEKLGLVNGYLNGFICRLHHSDLLRTLTDATEDSEFSVRHYAKDGRVLRYRMYAGITSPYLNRGGLQTKFERTGEKVTAADRGRHRKLEERSGATRLHELFPRLVGPPRPRRDLKTMEVVFHPYGYPPGEGSKRKMLMPSLVDEDKIEYVSNPKLVGSVSHGLYEAYKKARSVKEARSLGARPIDFAFDTNWGYLQLRELAIQPASWECEVLSPATPSAFSGARLPTVAQSKSKFVKVRTRELSEGCQGIDLPRKLLTALAKRCPSLEGVSDGHWATPDGPLAQVKMSVVRVLLYWATTGKLRYLRKQTKGVYAALRSCKDLKTARAVKRLEAAEEREEQRAQAEKKAPLGSQFQRNAKEKQKARRGTPKQLSNTCKRTGTRKIKCA